MIARELGTLTKIDARQVWRDEARDFTPDDFTTLDGLYSRVHVVTVEGVFLTGNAPLM